MHLDYSSRCERCLDPCRPGWTHCDKCHAWDDLAASFAPANEFDEFRYRRARRYFARRRIAGPVERLVAKLARRVAELEYRAGL